MRYLCLLYVEEEQFAPGAPRFDEAAAANFALDELDRPFRSSVLVAARLHRFKLGWLVLPRLIATTLSTAHHGWRGDSWAPASTLPGGAWST